MSDHIGTASGSGIFCGNRLAAPASNHGAPDGCRRSQTALPKLAGQGYRLGLITNDAEATARAHARMLGLDHVLEFVAEYDSGLGAKPERGPVIAFAADVGVSTNEIVVSVISHSTLLQRGTLEREWSPACLAGAEPDAVVASIMELPAWLEAARVIAS